MLKEARVQRMLHVKHFSVYFSLTPCWSQLQLSQRVASIAPLSRPATSPPLASWHQKRPAMIPNPCFVSSVYQCSRNDCHLSSVLYSERRTTISVLDCRWHLASMTHLEIAGQHNLPELREQPRADIVARIIWQSSASK